MIEAAMRRPAVDVADFVPGGLAGIDALRRVGAEPSIKPSQVVVGRLRS